MQNFAVCSVCYVCVYTRTCRHTYMCVCSHMYTHTDTHIHRPLPVAHITLALRVPQSNQQQARSQGRSQHYLASGSQWKMTRTSRPDPGSEPDTAGSSGRNSCARPPAALSPALPGLTRATSSKDTSIPMAASTQKAIRRVPLPAPELCPWGPTLLFFSNLFPTRD